MARMRITGIFEAKQNFSALIDAVAAGEEVRITRHGKELVRMLPITAKAMPTDAQVQRDVTALQRLRERVKPGPGWRELRDEGRKS
jgi:prevent-host-death family protein